MAKLNLNALVLNARLNANRVAERKGFGFTLVAAGPVSLSCQRQADPCVQTLGLPDMPTSYRDHTPMRTGRSDGLAGGSSRLGLEIARSAIAKRWSGITESGKCPSEKQRWFRVNLVAFNASAEGVR
ncbi:MAG TPA: hypothetical protein VKS79_11955 [Gemmataceae bacterium]|nr:hypothetical protein [Gemmataceae bacterium]